MYHGQLIFAQAIDHLPHHTLRRCIQRYQESMGSDQNNLLIMQDKWMIRRLF